MSALLLESGDLRADATGTIATCTGKYASAQTAATAIKLRVGDAWFRQEAGINWAGYLQTQTKIAGVRADVIRQASKGEGVTNARVRGLGLRRITRTLAGTVELKTANGVVNVSI